MKNFEFEYEGKKLWYSRSVAAAVALIAFRDNIPHMLIVQRGPNATHPGKWCIPGGFLEHDELISDCAKRELFEETGISLQPSKEEDPLTRVCIIDDPKTSSMQNVVFVYKVIRGNAMDEELSLANAEPGEISAVKWIPVSDFDNIDWAFNGAYQSEMRILLKHSSDKNNNQYG